MKVIHKLLCLLKLHSYEYIGIYRDEDSKNFKNLAYNVYRCKFCGETKKFTTYYFGCDELPLLKK